MFIKSIHFNSFELNQRSFFSLVIDPLVLPLIFRVRLWFLTGIGAMFFIGAEPSIAQSGSLWSSNNRTYGGNGSMFADHVAGRVGDLVTIRVNLANEVSKSAETDTEKSTSVSDVINALVYPQTDGTWDWYRYRDQPPTNNWSSSKDFKGGGSISNSETFSTTVQAVVIQEFPNGVLKIEARRNVAAADENSEMVLSGLIRREDLATDNSVDSTQIADLHIKQKGSGAISREQKKGWLTKLYEFLTPF